jgi:hypothetical protein
VFRVLAILRQHLVNILEGRLVPLVLQIACGSNVDGLVFLEKLKALAYKDFANSYFS